MNNLFQQGGIPVPTQRPYPSNQQAQPVAPQNPTAPQGGLGGLFAPPKMNDNMRNLMMAAGMSMGNGGRGFGQNLMAMQQQNQGQAQKAQQANMTAKWLEAKGADPQLVQMAQAGMGGQALELYKSNQPAEVKKPASIQEFEFAKQQGFDGSYMDYRTAMKGGTTVNVGGGAPEYSKLPAGYVYKRNPDGTIANDENGLPVAMPIPGGPADIEASKIEDANRNKQDLQARGGNVVLDDIRRAKETINQGGFLNGTGLTGSLMKDIPGTDAHSLQNKLTTIKANAGFDKLQQMRDASPTGGALGQVSERELKFLQGAIGSLDQSQTQEELLYNLERVERIYNEIIHGTSQAPSQESVWQDLGNGIRIREKK